MQIPSTTFDPGATPGTAATLNESGKPNIRRFYGKYRGKVVENIDPLFLGRIIPIVPALSTLPLTWAMPCTPYAGPGVGFYAIPPLDANVWIEFEGGDPDFPIWTGCFWEEGQVPLEAPPPGTSIFKTEFITVILNDEEGVTLEITPPAVDAPITITMDSAGIQIVTEATFDLTSQVTNITSDEVAVESDDVNISGAALTIESAETNITGDALTIESEETNIAGGALTVESGETNIASDAFTVETEETNIASLSVDIEAAESNLASALFSVEGLVSIEGDAFIDEMQVMVIPF